MAADKNKNSAMNSGILSLLLLLFSLFILIVKLMIVDLAVLRSVYI